MKQNLFQWAEEDAPVGPVFPNEVIRASAGTGKTFQLSNRYIALAQASDRPDEILAATFARKAAGEILDRVVLRLAEAASDTKKLAELSSFVREQNTSSRFGLGDCLDLLAKVIRNLHRLRISTLDSFFVQIAGSFGLELGLPPGWSIVDEVADRRLRSLAIQDVLAEGSVSELLTLLHLLNKGDVSRAVSDQIRRTANELYNLYRETTPDSQAAEMPAVWQAIKRYKKLEEDEWDLALATLAMLQFPNEKRIQTACQRDLELATAGDWDKMLSGGFVKLLLEGKGTYYNKPVPPELAAVYAPIIEHVKSQLVNRIADQTEATWKLLDKFHRAYQALKNDQRAFRFQDITQMLASAMGEMDSDQIGFRLDAGVGHLLLDEFQDTSLLQWMVLEPFAKAAARDPKYSFFCVGDVKQAIYGWRGGVADLFASLDQQLENLTERELTRSYRSSRVVIDVVNEVFGTLEQNPIMPKLPGVAEVWRKRFQTHSTARDFPGYCVLRTGTLDEDESQSVETLKFAAAEVARLHRESPGATIGILVRKNSAVARMIYELRHTHKIEASEEGGNPLLDSSAVQLVLSLLAIADHPGDSIARFHVANSALGKIVGFTLYTDNAAARRLSSEIRRSLLERGYGATIRQWTRDLTPFCNQRELTRLLQLVSLAYRYEDQATEQAQDFIEMVSLTKVEDPKAADVRVMNIHQSKGLEFDIVVLPELDSPLGGMTPPVVVGRKSPTAPVESVFRYIPRTVLPLLPERFTAMLEVHNLQIHNESLCLLYVAMTRAVHALYLIVAPSRANERSLPKTFAGLLRAGLHEGKIANPAEQVLYEHGDPNWFAKRPAPASETTTEPEEVQTLRIKLRPVEKSKDRRWGRQAPSDLEGGPVVHLGRLFREDSVLSRTRGSLWHAWLELVDWRDDPQTPLPAEEKLRQLAGQFLHPRLKLEDEISRFQHAINQPAIRQALSREQYGPVELKLHHEHPFADQQGQILTQGFIDRLVLIKQDGKVIAADILDFKTDRLPENDPQALKQLGQFYKPQLQAYRAAIEQAFSLSQTAVSARLLFLEAGQEWRLA